MRDKEAQGSRLKAERQRKGAGIRAEGIVQDETVAAWSLDI
jgi:hypothetical protein